MAKIIKFTGITKLDLPVDTVLDGAKDQLEGVIIIGYTKDGDEYFASTYADGGTALWLIEKCKINLMSALSDE